MPVISATKAGRAWADVRYQTISFLIFSLFLISGEARPALVALITDIQAGFTDFDREMLQIIKEQGYPCVIVANKTDKLNQKEIARELLKMKKESSEIEIFPHSAKTKEGTDALRKKLLEVCK